MRKCLDIIENVFPATAEEIQRRRACPTSEKADVCDAYTGGNSGVVADDILDSPTPGTSDVLRVRHSLMYDGSPSVSDSRSPG